MRRAFVSALSIPALLLAACDGDADSPTLTGAPAETIGTTTADPDGDSDEASNTGTPGDTGAPATGSPDDGATQTDSAAEVEGGADGQAAADVTKAFYLAVVNADPEACDYLLSFSDPERPMIDIDEDLAMCQEITPPVLASALDVEGIDEEAIAIFEAMSIRGADVNDDGSQAIVDADNVSTWFADALSSNPIHLRKIDGSWYVDINLSFPTTSES